MILHTVIHSSPAPPPPPAQKASPAVDKLYATFSVILLKVRELTFFLNLQIANPQMGVDSYPYLTPVQDL
jgi:hypothetical protein